MIRPLALATAALLGLAACTPPPDSATRMGPSGLRVELTAPRTCLDRQCLQYDALRDRVSVPGHEAMRVPRRMRASDGYISSTDFRELLILARNTPVLAD